MVEKVCVAIVFLNVSAVVSGVMVFMYMPVLFSNPAQMASLG